MSTYKPLIVSANPGHIDQLDDPDGLSIAHIADTDYIDFDLTPNIPAHQTGRLHWHETDGTLSLGMIGSEVELQIGQEHLILVKNVTGNTINNGTPVYFTGVDSGRPTVATANAARELNPVPTFVRGLLTETINTGNEGYMLVAGLMRDVNTANWAPNTQLFLDITEGGYTNPRPEAPGNVRGIGVVIVQHATEGSILVSLDPIYDLEWASNVYSTTPFETDQFLGWKPDNGRYELLRSQRNHFNGTFRESFDAVIDSSDATTIQLTLEQAGGGDLTMQFTDGDSQLDCTPAQTINITPGTDGTPTGTMVYIPLSTKTLAAATVWPSEEHIKVCYVAVPSAQFVFDYGGPYVNQNWNDHLSDTAGVIGQGHLSHITKKIRLSLGASWYSGVNPDGATDSYYTIGAGTAYWVSTAGVISQMHDQSFGAKDTSANNVILVANDFTAPYTPVSNLDAIDTDSTGNSIGNNRYFSLIFWGVQNKTDQGSGIMVNLPAGNYTSETSAVVDNLNYDDYSFPREFNIDSGTAFLICRSTFKMGATWVHIQTEDLRGKTPSTSAGGGTGTSDHGSLGGLADDDHLQYALVDGTRAFTGNVTMDQRLAVGGGTSAYSATVLIDETVNTTNFVFGQLMEGSYESQDASAYGSWLNPSLNPATFQSTYMQTITGMVVADSGDTVTRAVGQQLGAMSKTGTGNITTAIGLFVNAQGIGESNYGILVDGGNSAMQADNSKWFYGQGDDASVYYDGTDLVIDPKEQGTGNLHVLGTVEADDEVLIDGLPAMVALTANIFIYVATDGNDTTGDGSTSNEFLTVARAIEELKKYNPAGNTITVWIREGAYAESWLQMNYFGGPNVIFRGAAATNETSLSLTNIDAAATDMGTGLEYVDFDVVLTGTYTVSANYSTVIVKTASGGTNPNLALGAHEVVAWDSGTRTATCRILRRVTTSGGLPSGAITADTLTVLGTRLNIDAELGLDVLSGTDGGEWQHLCMYGQNNSALTKYAFLCRKGATLKLGLNCCSMYWYYNVYAREGSTISTDKSYHSGSWQYNYHANWAGNLYVTNDISNGSIRGGVRASRGSTVTLQGTRINAYGTIGLCRSDTGSFIDADSLTNNGYHAGAPNALVVESGGGILSTNTVAQYTTALRSTISGTLDAGAYHAY